MLVAQHNLETMPRTEVLNSDLSAIGVGSRQSDGQRHTHRFNLPPNSESLAARRRAASLKRCRLFDERDPITVKQATTREELEEAYCLVHESYIEAGYMDPHPSGLRVRIFEALPHTVTFIAQEQGKVIGTISLVLDSPLGLPMEESFGEELDGLRQQGRRIAEVSSLAVAKGCRNLGVFVRLCKYMTLYAIHAGLDDLCIGISPEHAPFFQEVYLFEPLGDVRSYSSAKEDYVVAVRLDLPTLEQRIRDAYADADADADLYRFVFVYRQPDNPTPQPVMTPELMRYFFVEKTNVLPSADVATINVLQNFYPFIDVRGVASSPTIYVNVQWSKAA
jgi:hypothetical protein